ncbi:MAG: hypothetical protein ABIN55_06180 [Aeromicrobium sp.]
MDDGDRLAEYRAYYRARAERYAANPLYPESAAAEKAMSEAMDAATSFEEFRSKAIEMSMAMGHALARDQARARLAVYQETAEHVRAKGSAEVIAGIDAAKDAPALASMLSEIEQRTQRAVTADELLRIWHMSLTGLENIEVWRTAVVPDRWRSELEGFAAETVSDERKVWKEVLEEASRHQAGWTFDSAAARAERHRRLVPVSDEVFERRLAEHGSLLRGEKG